MPQPPEDEVESGAMPEAADQHRGEDVEVNSRQGRARTTQRNEDVINEPLREGYVPVAPKFRDICLEVGPVEVLFYPETEQAG